MFTWTTPPPTLVGNRIRARRVPGHDAQRVGGGRPRAPAGPAWPVDVLEERPAREHVDRLEAAADPQHRQRRVPRPRPTPRPRARRAPARPDVARRGASPVARRDRCRRRRSSSSPSIVARAVGRGRRAVTRRRARIASAPCRATASVVELQSCARRASGSRGVDGSLTVDDDARRAGRGHRRSLVAGLRGCADGTEGADGGRRDLVRIHLDAGDELQRPADRMSFGSVAADSRVERRVACRGSSRRCSARSSSCFFAIEVSVSPDRTCRQGTSGGAWPWAARRSGLGRGRTATR